MENKPSTNVFQEVHQKIQAAKDKARKAKEAATDMHRENAKEEAVREGFDRAATSDTEPH
jgi:hypothetical protein